MEFILIIAFILALLFLFLGYPIWTIVHCIISEDRGKTSKVVWVILMILIWPLTSIVYGLFASKKLAFKIISGLSITIAALSVPLYFNVSNEHFDALRTKIDTQVAEMDQINFVDVSPDEIHQLKDALLVLKGELSGGIMQIQQKMKASDIMEIYDMIENDLEIDATEYKNWMRIFETRALIEEDELSQYVREYKSNSYQNK